MSLYKSINIDGLDKRFQVTFLKKYNDNKEKLKNSKNSSEIKESTSNLIYLTKTILKDLIIMPFGISFLTALGKIFLSKYSVILYRHGFVMGVHFKKLLKGYYKEYFLPIPAPQ